MGKKGDKSSAPHSPASATPSASDIRHPSSCPLPDAASLSPVLSPPTAMAQASSAISSIPVFSEPAMRNNLAVLEYSRTCQAVATGAASGILGLTGVAGFVFYFLVVLIQALIWQVKAGFQWRDYFLDRWAPLTHSVVSGLFTYILFWVFLYGMVHVY